MNATEASFVSVSKNLNCGPFDFHGGNFARIQHLQRSHESMLQVYVKNSVIVTTAYVCPCQC